MKIKRFVSDSFPEAMKQAKEEMGDEAIIIHSRKFKEGGILGLFARERCEITVAMDENNETFLSSSAAAAIRRDEGSGHNPQQPGREEATSYTTTSEVLEEIRSMRLLVEDLKDRMEDDNPKVQSRNGRLLYKFLCSRQVEPKLANRIVKMVEERMERENSHDFSRAKELSIQVIAEIVKMPRGIEFKDGKPRIVALIGPTGVGKTTTIAKLAARFGLMEKKRVALVTVDTYRIAAVEQLKTYADIIGLPLEVVFKTQDLRAAIEGFSNRDLILIDTAGRSPRNESQMMELVGFLQEANPDEIILVLSATTRTEDLLDAYHRFNVVRIDKIIFTKLDETSCYGPMLNVIHRTRKRLSYITNGQNVPDDIELLDDFKFAQLILGDD